MTVAKIKKQLLGGSISKTQYDINIKRIKKRAEMENARLQAAKSPIDKAQEKAKAAASLLNRLIMKANQVKLNTKRTKSNKAAMLAIAENIKEVEATRRVLCRLSGAKKAHLSHTHLSHTRIIHTHHTHVSYTRIIHTYRKELSRTSIEHT